MPPPCRRPASLPQRRPEPASRAHGAPLQPPPPHSPAAPRRRPGPQRWAWAWAWPGPGWGWPPPCPRVLRAPARGTQTRREHRPGIHRVAAWSTQGCSLGHAGLQPLPLLTSAATATSLATVGSSASMPSILRACGSSEAASRAVPFSSAAKTLAVALPSLGRGWAGPVLVGASSLRHMGLQARVRRATAYSTHRVAACRTHRVAAAAHAGLQPAARACARVLRTQRALWRRCGRRPHP